MPDGVKRYRARYALSMWEELERSVELADGEAILAAGRVKVYGNWFYQPPGALQITTSRLLVLTHHLIAPDQILDVPLAAVRRIGGAEPRFFSGGGWCTIEYQDADGPATLRLMPWGNVRAPTAGLLQLSDRLANGGALVEDPDALIFQLRQAVQSATDSPILSASKVRSHSSQ